MFIACSFWYLWLPHNCFKINRPPSITSTTPGYPESCLLNPILNGSEIHSSVCPYNLALYPEYIDKFPRPVVIGPICGQVKYPKSFWNLSEADIIFRPINCLWQIGAHLSSKTMVTTESPKFRKLTVFQPNPGKLPFQCQRIVIELLHIPGSTNFARW